MMPGVEHGQDILDAVNFVDRIIFGKTNYCKQVSAYKQNKAFYNGLAAQVISFCIQHGIQCHIKEKTITEERGKDHGAFTGLNTKIEDPVLRDRIMQETDKLIKQKSLDWCLKSICQNARRSTMYLFVLEVRWH